MLRYALLILTAVLVSTLPAAESGLRILVVTGTGGTGEYQEIFQENAQKWKAAAEKGDSVFQWIGGPSSSDTDKSDPEKTDAEKLEEALASIEEPELWLVLVGHGTFDTREVKFNLHGPDVTDRELAEWARKYDGRLSVINTASASGSFIRQLSGEDRVIITATKNESEVFYTPFGGFFADAIAGQPDADLDNDDQVSLLEAFIFASDSVAGFYENEGRLATEHAMIDDNADGVGSRAEWFEGTTATQTPGKDKEADGELATQRVLVKNEFEKRLTPAQRERRDALEIQVKDLRKNRDALEEEAYYDHLETLLLELGRLYRQVSDS